MRPERLIRSGCGMCLKVSYLTTNLLWMLSYYIVGPCATNYGGCSQFCWTTSSTTRVCDCTLGFFLASDGQTCNHRKSHKSPDSFWTIVCNTVRHMLSVRCLRCLSCLYVCLSVCLSVCDVGVLWPNGGWIKMKLGMPVASALATLR